MEQKPRHESSLWNAPTLAVLTWIGLLLLFAAIGLEVYRGKWQSMLVLTGFLIASGVFVVKEQRLPRLFDFLFVVAALINAGGWVWNWFTELPGYDEVAHAFTIFSITLSFGYLAFYSLRDNFRLHRLLFGLAIVTFGIAVGTVWEIVEWIFLGELKDTPNDLVMNTIGATIAAVIASRAIRHA